MKEKMSKIFWRAISEKENQWSERKRQWRKKWRSDEDNDSWEEKNR